MKDAVRTQRRGVWLLGDDPRAAHALARAGFDWITVDLQHGRIDESAAYELLLATAGTIPRWVRVAGLDAARIGRALDAGADGVIVPQVGTVAEAHAAVRAAQYPPTGARSWGPLGGYDDGNAAASVEVAVMIESAEGLDAVTAIAAVPGVDLVFVGPFDLALALGTSVDALLTAAESDPMSPLVRIRDAAASAGVRIGAFAGSPEAARRFRALGYDDLVVTTDAALLAAGVDAVLAALDER